MGTGNDSCDCKSADQDEGNVGAEVSLEERGGGLGVTRRGQIRAWAQ